MADRDIDRIVERIVSASGIRGDEEREHLRRELRAHFEDGGPEALMRFGSTERVGASLQRVHRRRWGSGGWRDLRFAWRMLRRAPGFAVLAIACLTLGIGSNAAVFSWIEGVLLRPYPLVSGQDRLLAVTAVHRGDASRDAMSWPDFMDLSRNATLIDASFAEKITGATLGLGDRAERATGSMVSANYFDAIGVSPILGRGFAPGEDVGRGTHPIVVISYDMWQRRFEGRQDVVGRTQLLNGQPYTIVGVAPRGFYGTFVGYPFEFWVPASMQLAFDAGVYKLEDRGARWVEGYVRVKPGVSAAQAQAEASAIMTRLEEQYPATNRGVGIRLYPLWQTPFNGATSLLPTLEIALVVVLAVLLIACANVGNLLLVRAVARQREMTIRLSIGASRRQLLRQLLLEGVMLASIATVASLGVAYWLRDALASLTPDRGVAIHIAGHLDARVFALSAGLCLVATPLFALAPALLASRVDIAGALRAGGGAVVGSRRRAWLRSALVVVQISLSFVLLVATGLLVESLQAMRRADPGFAANDVAVMDIGLFAAGFDQSRARAFEDAMVDRVRAIAGVESVSFARVTPFTYRPPATARITVTGFDTVPGEQPTASYNQVGEDFLRTMGIPLVRGREFTRADDDRGTPAAIVDETMAKTFWRGGDPVGQVMRVDDKPFVVVGVARAVKYQTLQEAPKPYFYVSRRQMPTLTSTIFIRTQQAPASLRPMVTSIARQLAPTAPLWAMQTLRQDIDLMSWSERVGVSMVTLFGVAALLLAAVGLYGVMASTVAQSARELALRIALGAAASDLFRLVLSAGLLLTASGLAIGLLVAMEVTRLLGYMLYGVSPLDPLSFAVAAAVILMASFAACLGPAWKATRSDPLTALRA